MSWLLLAVGLALAEPDPSIPAPSPTMHPVEVSEPVEVTELGEADVVADGELVPDVVIERKDPTPFQRLISGFVWIMSFFVIAPYEDEALTLVVAGLFAEARLWLDRKRRQRKDLEDEGSERLGALQERTLRNLASDLVQQEVNEALNLQRTRLDLSKQAYQEREVQHLAEMEALKAAHAEQLEGLAPLAALLEEHLADTVEGPA
tara:strand:- start:2 stop:616 length:615 start_codon:yes stop_codon:yes gene_type:complete